MGGGVVLNLQGKTDQVHSRPIHRNSAGQEGVAGYIQRAELAKYATKNSLSTKAVIQNRKIKTFPNIQKLKVFVVTTKPALQEILRETLWRKDKTKQKRSEAIKTRKDQRPSSETPTLQKTQWH